MLRASNLLDLWERGLTDRPIKRTLNLLSAAYPELSIEQLKELPIGQRDVRLLALHEALFGPRLNCVTACPKCGERLEITFDVAEIQNTSLETPSLETYAVALDGYNVQFRLPNSSDLLSIKDLQDANQARRILFERCVQQANRNELPISANDISDELMDAIAARMAGIDPQANIQIALTCPACSGQWSALFDIASYVWTEVNAWAVRLLNEIHCIASAYGWREEDILAMSPMRRQLYLEMID